MEKKKKNSCSLKHINKGRLGGLVGWAAAFG